jgi:hypothetical protein
VNDEYYDRERDRDRRLVNSHRDNSSRDSLVERLDPALGEASAGIGVLLSELVRRTLRGGVAMIDEEMHEFVEEKLSVAVESRMPDFEAAATRTAEAKARDIAHEEVQRVEVQSRESAERLSSDLQEARRQAEEAARKLEDEARSAAERLAQEIAATEQRAEDKARVLTQDAVGVVEQEAKAATERLTANIAETERRAEERAREIVARELEELRQKAKGTYVQIREALDELGTRATTLQTQLGHEQTARDAALAELGRGFDASLQREAQGLRELLSQLRAENALLELRVVELEKPRGLRALWLKLFGRKKKAATTATASVASAE